MSVEPSNQSFTALRIICAILAVPLSAFAFLFSRGGFDLFGAGFILGFSTAAAWCWWFTFRGQIAKHRTLMLFALGGAIIIGGIGFVAGFVGPIIFTPDANQGPLLGIFVTGPLGFVAGAWLGLCVGIVRLRFAKPRGSF